FFIVDAGMPHAIGPGLTLLEIMEPTDYTIHPEKYFLKRELPASKRFGGLPPEQAMKLFDCPVYTNKELTGLFRPKPELLTSCHDAAIYRLLPQSHHGYFRVQLVQIHGEWQQRPEDCFRVLFVKQGTVQITYRTQTLFGRAGDSFFLPFSVSECRMAGQAEIAVIMPPVTES
ncbi:MAG TPA: hypothetical protein DC049_04120, partial [Spirochaetia bacterium]|nr:hypothetical protein [Spirochaetia bacterium]